MALSRLNRRVGTVEGRKPSLSVDLGLDADKEVVMSLAWLRYQYSMNTSPTTIWGQANGYLLYGVLEYIVKYQDNTAGRVDGIVDTLWDFLENSKKNDPYRTWHKDISAAADFASKSKKEKLVAALQAFPTLQTATPGFEGPKDADHLITKIVISIMKRGTISTALVTKMNTDLTADGMLGARNPLTAEQVRLIFDQFGKDFVSMKLPQALCEDTENVRSIRFNLCRRRIRDSTLTSYRAIVRAQELLPSFPWDKVFNLFPQQLKAYQTLKGKVEANPFFGYEAEASNQGVSLYPDLYALARKLIIDHVGDQNFRNHVVSAKPTNPNLIDTLFKIYKTKEDKLVYMKTAELFEDLEEDDA